MRWLGFDRQPREGSKWRQCQRCALLCGSDDGLQGAHCRRLPAVRFSLVRLAETHEPIVRQFANRRGGELRGALFGGCLDDGIGTPKMAHVVFDLCESDAADGSWYARKTL